MANDELWSDEICALVDAGLFSRNPSDHETAVAYRTAIAAARAQGYAEAKEQAAGICEGFDDTAADNPFNTAARVLAAAIRAIEPDIAPSLMSETGAKADG